MPLLTIFIFRFKNGSSLIGMLLFVILLSHSIPSEAQGKSPAHSSCMAQLQSPSSKKIDCTLTFYLDKPTQKSMQGNTAGMIKNAACNAKISVSKNRIFTALRNEKVLQIPKQPVSCNIYTMGDPVLTKFNMAPKIRFANGKAVQAKPDMSDVLGLPVFLANLLTNWVNSSQAIETALLNEVNQSLKMIRPPRIENQNGLEKRKNHSKDRTAFIRNNPIP